ncbi:MAG: quinone oxidoreductase [Bryobacterales bacterium]|nr:quinone oxidoreductase [Bryobacterales bacterium]MBV9398062.1 quinone oxidoreductase [Bryobacterales bacterium]
MKAVYIEQNGGVDMLRYGDRAAPEPAAGEVLVKVAASGVNFIDTYHRTGLYKLPLPAIIGSEAAGVVEKTGEGVNGFKPGDRVAYAMARGSYAEYQAVPARLLVHVPAGVELRDAAATMLQGMTAYYLSHATFPLKSGHTALVHAAAGGTGRLLAQMAAMAGARVIATAGTPAKADIAREAGAHDVILYDQQDWVAEVKKLTGGDGVDVVYDSVGRATFMKGLDCLKPCGMMVSFGQSSGPVEAFDILLLSSKGSLYVTRPTLANHVGADELARSTSDLFSWIKAGKLKLLIGRTYKLADAAQAHKDLEGRKSTGKLVLEL